MSKIKSTPETYLGLIELEVSSSWLENFKAQFSFELDGFQRDAIDLIDQGYNVLVGAPTGAGKTIVGDAGVYHAMHVGHARQLEHAGQHVQSGENTSRVYYTTPIKALSNQKYRELQNKYGAQNVGLVTGDVVINSDARIVVMTTEVLRNQVYSKSDLLHDLYCVVMDEVHFLGDRTRGSVWEEVLINLPQHVRIIALSATVSNLEEFATWLDKIRGNCKTVVTEKRPIPLVQHMVLSDDEKPNARAKLWDIYLEDGKTNQKLMHKMLRPMKSLPPRRPKGRSGKGRSFPNAEKTKGLRKIPTRASIIQELKNQDILPAIYFIFSRAGCDDAVNDILHSSITLTTPSEQDKIAYTIDTFMVGRIEESDLKMLGFSKLRQALMQGVAAHHAGLLPAFKELVEHLFERGLLKVVFATETLALGINMPARSVVVERLTKYDGTGHNRLTPGQFTQLTGRAGRRGLDTIGHAVVVDGRNLTLPMVTSLASNRVYPLLSAFTPRYNMTVNLASEHSNDYVEDILRKSYAQFQLNFKNQELAKRITDYNSHLAMLEQEVNEHPERTSRLKNRINKVKSRRGECEQVLHNNQMKIVDKYYKIVDVLLHFDYLRQVDDVLVATPRGDLLKNFYCEYELVLTEALYRGILKEMTCAELTATISCFVSLAKNAQQLQFRPKWIPGGSESNLAHKLSTLHGIYKDVEREEKFIGVQLDTEESGLNFGMLEVAYRWGRGQTFEQVIQPLGDARLGDFIRLARGVLDILQQIVRYMGDYAPDNAQKTLEILQDGFIAGLLD